MNGNWDNEDECRLVLRHGEKRQLATGFEQVRWNAQAELG